MMLILSLIPLWFGPLLFSRIRRNSPWISFLNGFIFVSLVGLLFFSIIPESLEVSGAWGLVSLAVGMWLPVVMERVFKVNETSTHLASFVYVGIGLSLHAALDGTMLAEMSDFSEHQTGEMLGIAVILHRIPLGFGLWWLVRPHFGNRLVLWLLFWMTGGTVVGYYGVNEIVNFFPAQIIQCFQALVAGSLLHIIFHNTFQHSHSSQDQEHQCHHDHEPDQFHWVEVVGNVFGFIVLVGAVMGHQFVHDYHAEADEAMGVGMILYVLLGWSAPLFYAFFAMNKSILKSKELSAGSMFKRFSAFHLFAVLLTSLIITAFGDSADSVNHFIEELHHLPLWGMVMSSVSGILTVVYLYFMLSKGVRSYFRQFF